MKKSLFVCAVMMLLLGMSPKALALVVGFNPDIHMDIQGVIANDFHVQGRLESGNWGGNWSNPPVLISHVDGGFTNFKYSITPDLSDPFGQNWYDFTADWSGKDYRYCEVLHLGLFFDVTCNNVAVNLVGWWTVNGQPIPIPLPPTPPPVNGGSVPIPGFNVRDIPHLGMPQMITLFNHSRGGGGGGGSGGIETEIVRMDLVGLTKEELESKLGPIPRAFEELRVGGAQETLPWVPVENERGIISESNPQPLMPDSFFDVFLDVSGPIHPMTPVPIPPGGFLVAREQVRFVNNAGQREIRWDWMIHGAHESDLGDAPDGTNSFGTPPPLVLMTAYPKGGPAGVIAHYPTVYQAGSPPYGPIHWAAPLIAFLGPWVSSEMEADIGPDMDPTNNIIPLQDAPDLDNFDDGVIFPIVMPYCQLTTFNYVVNIMPPMPPPMPQTPPLYVNVWFDWNRDGDWDDTLECPGDDVLIPAPEWAVQNQLLVGLPVGLNTITTPQFMPWHPATGDTPPIWMRITLSEQRWSPTSGVLGDGGCGPKYGYIYGETEDYYFVPEVPPTKLDFGDAPEYAKAYIPCKQGMFPTCINPSPPQWIQHAISTPSTLYFGPMVDGEIEGNGGLCAMPPCFPPYDVDECFQDGDSGLIRPPSYTIRPVGAVLQVQPCIASQTGSLGTVCQLATWGANVDIDVTNKTSQVAYVNVLMDWDKSGTWGGASVCPPCLGGGVAPEHVLVNFVVPAGYIGPLSGLMLVPLSFMVGPNPEYVWTRFTVTPDPVGATFEWNGEGQFRNGETEDYLLHVKPAPDTSDCDWNIGDDHKMHHPQLPDLTPTGVDVDMAWTPLADDFKCSQTGKITDIHFWGSFADDCLPAGGPASLTFQITIYSDIPANESSTGYSMPGEPLWTRRFEPCTYTVRQVADSNVEDWYDPATNLYLPQNHFQAYQYNICMADADVWEQQAGRIYWLEIKDIVPDDQRDYTFGWKTTQLGLRWNDDAVYRGATGGWAELRYPRVPTPGHPYAGQSMDLAFVITGEAAPPPDTDWGDAPDPTYPTLAVNLGASHTIVPFVFMGAGVDGEPDGQPNVGATGDDADIDPLNLPPNFDDEDGVSFDTPMIPGLMAQITVNASLANAFISVWVDFDGDGGWGQAQDYVVQSALSVVGNNVFQFPVPAGAVPGTQAYVRVRFTTFRPIGFDGPAPNGEVEDYVVTIEAPYEPKPPVEHVKWSQPPIEIDPMLGRMPTYCGWDEPSWARQETMPPFEPCPALAADDFRCLGRMPITSVHWWGSHYGWMEPELPPVPPTGWRITFWRNVPPNQVPYSQPGERLWTIDVKPDQVEIERVGVDQFPDMPPDTCFQYHVKLPEAQWFWQERYLIVGGAAPDTVFWISIQAIYPVGAEISYPWGWKTRPAHWMDDAVRHVGDPGTQCVWRPIEASPACGQVESFDLAFELDTDPNYIKWEQPFTGLRHWKHYEDEESTGIETEETPAKWIQEPNTLLPGLHCHDSANGWMTLADDWKCTGGNVTDFHWYGNYERPGSGVRQFHLSIHEPSMTPPCLPGRQVWGIDVPFAQANETDTGLVNVEGGKIYRYDYVLTAPFPQIKDTHYWLDISARSVNPMDPAIWRWQESRRSPQPILCGAVERYDPMPGTWQTIVWTTPSGVQYSDMAFAVTSGAPEKVVHINRLVADDWPCKGQQPVSAIAWWGSYIGLRYEACQCGPIMLPPRPDYFLLQIWTDIPADPTNPNSYSTPGEVVWTYKAYSYDEVLVGFDKHPETGEPGQLPGREPVFRYSLRLPKENWFHQKKEESVYWLSIVAVYKDGIPSIPWGWTNHPHVYNDDAVVGVVNAAGGFEWRELRDQEGKSEDMSFILFTEPGCFPSWYTTYQDWLTYGKPNCWCGIYGTPPWPYQCDGDADGAVYGYNKYRVYNPDLTLLINNWKKKIDDPTINPCADIDHKGYGFNKYRVYNPDLTILINNWKRKDFPDLPANCPRPE
jgi:hypothetical protein